MAQCDPAHPDAKRAGIARQPEFGGNRSLREQANRAGGGGQGEDEGTGGAGRRVYTSAIGPQMQVRIVGQLQAGPGPRPVQ